MTSEEIGVKFMQAWEEKILEKQKARKEGLAEGRDQLLMDQIQKKLTKGCSPEEIADALETDLSIVRQFIEKLTDNS